MPEIVVKRAWPCSSRLMPVGAPIGFSGRFFQSRQQGFFRPLFFARGGMPSLEHVGNRVFRDLRLGRLFVGHLDRCLFSIIEEGHAAGKVRMYRAGAGHPCPPRLTLACDPEDG